MDHKCSELHLRPMAAPVMAVHPCPAKPEMDDLQESLARPRDLARGVKWLLIILRMKKTVIILGADKKRGARDGTNFGV